MTRKGGAGRLPPAPLGGRVEGMAPKLRVLPIARFSLEQYHRMIESAALTEDARLELIDGWIVQKSEPGPGHEYTRGIAGDLLRRLIPGSWHIRSQAPITLDGSEPEPDLSVVRGGRAEYRKRHPRGDEVALVIEVSDTSLDVDRLKGVIYARATIPTYWIVNIAARSIEVYTQPSPSVEGGYASRRVAAQGETIPVVVAGADYGAVVVADVLP